MGLFLEMVCLILSEKFGRVPNIIPERGGCREKMGKYGPVGPATPPLKPGLVQKFTISQPLDSECTYIPLSIPTYAGKLRKTKKTIPKFHSLVVNNEQSEISRN